MLRSIFKKILFWLIFSFLLFWINNFSVNQVFAEKNDTQSTDDKVKDDKTLETVAKRLNEFLQLFSWFWIIPATIAWKLMTNWWVYWSGIHMDKYLWQLWQMMRNFANFFLGFLFIWMILWSFFKWSPWEVVKNYLPKILIATVLIQMSWFLMWALIDVSNILVAAVWSFPQQFLQNSDKIKNIQISKKTVIIDYTQPFWKLFEELKDQSQQQENKVSLKDILPKYDSVSWPLIYFWASALDIFNTFPLNNANEITAENLSISLLLKFILLVMFILPLIVLAIVNFVRIFWIWIFVIFSPFLVIDTVFKWMLSNKVW